MVRGQDSLRGTLLAVCHNKLWLTVREAARNSQPYAIHRPAKKKVSSPPWIRSPLAIQR
jgi:hypothetical protein